MMSDLMQDIATGRIGYREANAVCNAGGKLLKVIEMTHKYGRTQEQGRQDDVVLDLSDGD